MKKGRTVFANRYIQSYLQNLESAKKWRGAQTDSPVHQPPVQVHRGSARCPSEGLESSKPPKAFQLDMSDSRISAIIAALQCGFVPTCPILDGIDHVN